MPHAGEIVERIEQREMIFEPYDLGVQRRPGLPFNLRMTADVGGRKLALTVGETILWSGDRRRLLRRRRISFRPAAEKAPCDGAAMLRLID